MTIWDDFPSKNPDMALQPNDMIRILFMALLTLIKRRFGAEYIELKTWWSNQ